MYLCVINILLMRCYIIDFAHSGGVGDVRFPRVRCGCYKAHTLFSAVDSGWDGC